MSIVHLRCKKHNRDQKLEFRLWQVAKDPQGVRCCRDLTEENAEVAKGAWQRTPRPFEEGLYCRHCLSEGFRQLLPVDAEDLPDLDLGDTPVVFQDPTQFRAAEQAKLMEERFKGRIPAVQTLPGRPPVYATDEIITKLHPQLRIALKERVLPKGGSLYAFQAEAIERALERNDVIVTTPTASGKSLAYWVPVLDTLLRDPSATALYISPLVALTGDQLEAVSSFGQNYDQWAIRSEQFSIYRDCRSLSFGGQEIVVARYDGSVNDANRQVIRKKNPRVLFVTPDMLHAGLIVNSEKAWASFFDNLRYVVIDEFHTYRGILGASFANLMRRLERVLRRRGIRPQYLCASATLVDPVQTVRSILHREVIVIDGANSGPKSYDRTLAILDSASGGETRALATEAKNIILHLLEQRVRTIAFSGSIAEINNIYRIVDAELADRKAKHLTIKPYARELTREDKRRFIRDLREGRLHALISTSALSMGVDIGSLSAAVIIGFPGSIAQFWQQAGRAGRIGEGLIILIAGGNPLDQFFVNHPDRLFNLQAEPIYCNPDNPYIVRGHLLHAMRELPLAEEELEGFGPMAMKEMEHLCQEELANFENGFWNLTSGAGENLPPFRNIGFSVNALDENDKLVSELDLLRAHRAYHKYAIVQVVDRYYEVARQTLNLAKLEGKILLRRVERPDYLTKPRVQQEITFLRTDASADFGKENAFAGWLSSSIRIEGYYREPLFARTEKASYQPLGAAAPEPLTFETQGLWLTLSLESFGTLSIAEQNAGLFSFAGALRMATAIEELCDPSDIEAVSISLHPQTGQPTIVLYDTIPGGVGISHAAFQDLSTVLERAHQILAECPYCSRHPESRGCPQCVTSRYGDEESIDRTLALQLCDYLLAHRNLLPVLKR